MRIAAIEGGGTAWKVSIRDDNNSNNNANNSDNSISTTFSTTACPVQTLGQVRRWLTEQGTQWRETERQRRRGQAQSSTEDSDRDGERDSTESGTSKPFFDAIGIASFGPIDAKRGSATYGFITSTPKPGWQNTDVLRLLGIYDEFAGIPFEFDTDVNAPAMAEFMFRNEPGSTSIAYITIGTGVGVGLVANGQTVKGLLHPEAGHISVKLLPEEDFCGSCPFHGPCIEGMCSTVGLTARLKCSHEELPSVSDDHQVWKNTGYYIAQMCANLLLIASPEKIVIGGGVMKRKILFPIIREKFLEIVNGYIQHPSITKEGVESYITSSVWGDDAGIVGAVFLGKLALERSLCNK